MLKPSGGLPQPVCCRPGVHFKVVVSPVPFGVEVACQIGLGARVCVLPTSWTFECFSAHKDVEATVTAGARQSGLHSIAAAMMLSVRGLVFYVFYE